ncbi:tail fiber assembly protein [Plesiomonas sp. ZOR0011]|uniref:tail fiber assembly protein n=1 Tax=Plesiomonas sp. ZOR0011 TaxID=1339230 RepID=UPI000690F8C4|nr:tail fiber assembly protein [Plesiomonas sp. ZOR0011]
MPFIVYAKVGDSFQQIGGECPAGFIQMSGMRPDDGDYIAAETGEWIPVPPPTQEQLVSDANAKKQQFAVDAEAAIKPLERAKLLGIATESELALLNEWMRYSVELMRVDTSTAPDIQWPLTPTC